MATVTEAVKESLVGITIEPELSQEVRATFDRHAIQDDVTGESYMTEKEFVNAIAPVNEDYVSSDYESSCERREDSTSPLKDMKLTRSRTVA